MQKTIDLVLDWRSAFGLLIDGGGSESDIALSKSLIEEELEEYTQSVLEEDRIEQLDAIGDLFFVVVQLECMYRKPVYKSIVFNSSNIYPGMELLSSHEDNYFSGALELLYNLSKQLNVDLHDLVKEIYNSNMSKLCKDEQTAQETVEEYKKKGVETYYKVCPTDSSKYIVYRREDNKVLKSVDFVEPNIQKLLK